MRRSAYPLYLFLEGGTAFLFSAIFTASSVYQATSAGLTPLQLVLVGTTLEASVFLFEIPTGIVADAYSRRLSILIGLFLTGLAFLLEGTFPAFLPILLAQVVWGIGYTFTSGATQAWLTDETDEVTAGHAFLRASQLGTGLSILGIAAGTALGIVRINLPIQIGGIGFLLLAAALTITMAETGFHRMPDRDRNPFRHMASIFRQGMDTLRKRPMLWTVLGIGLFLGLYSEGIDRLWVRHLLELGFPLTITPVIWFGLLRMLSAVLSILSVETVRRRWGPAAPPAAGRILAAATAFLTIALVGFAWAPSLWAASGMFLLIGALRAVIGPVHQAWINDRLDSKVRATVLSAGGQVDAIGQVAGGPLVGAVGDYSVRAALAFSALLLSPAPFLARRPGRKAAGPPAAP